MKNKGGPIYAFVQDYLMKKVLSVELVRIGGRVKFLALVTPLTDGVSRFAAAPPRQNFFLCLTMLLLLLALSPSSLSLPQPQREGAARLAILLTHFSSSKQHLLLWYS